MSDIIIAGTRWRVGDPDVKVVTFLDPGGYSFYGGTPPDVVALTGSDPDTGDVRDLVRPRPRPAGAPPIPVGLLGAGWEKLDPGGSIAALKRVVHAVVLHHDGSPSSDACYRTLVQRALSSHFMIDRDGTVYQATDVADMAWHAQGMNGVAVGFDLNSTATNLLRFPDAPPPLGGIPSPTAEINGLQISSWTYSEEQYRSLIAVLRVLVEALGLEPAFPMDQNGGILRTVLADPPPEQFAGLQCHWHSEEQKWDPGPGLDWERVLTGLRKEDATFPAVPVVPDPRSLAGDAVDLKLLESGAFGAVEATRKALDASLSSEDTAARFLRMLALACEVESGGGYYPMGVNQTWHGGIHVPCVPGTPVCPLLKGEVAAVHLEPASRFPRGLGSNNFVLLRHRIPLPTGMRAAVATACKEPQKIGSEPAQVEEVARNELIVFSLYMHLDAVDWDQPVETGLLRKLTALSRDAPPPPPPPGPLLDSISMSEKVDPVAALKAGYVLVFPLSDQPGAGISVNTGDTLGLAGEFGESTGGRRLVHVEVFADDRYLQSMDLALYGRYLAPADDDPRRDLLVRSTALLQRYGWVPGSGTAGERLKRPVGLQSPKVLDAQAVNSFFTTDATPDARDSLRRMIVRHVSEWSDSVEWARTLLESQEWRDLLRDPGAGRRWFEGSVASWLRFTWLTDAVARQIGLAFKPGQEGVVATFHPVNFLLWWLFLRSAVRGKPLEDILRCQENRKSSMHEGVTEELGGLDDLQGQGEWETR